MKQRSITLLVLLCLGMANCLRAQPISKKPSQFSHFPDAISFSTEQLNALFSQQKGETATCVLPGNLQLNGPVTNKISRYNNTLETIVIKLPAFSNSIFTLSKRKEKDNKIVYGGHVFNSQFADGYQLKQGKNNDYQLVKTSTEQILQPCNY